MIPDKVDHILTNHYHLSLASFSKNQKPAFSDIMIDNVYRCCIICHRCMNDALLAADKGKLSPMEIHVLKTTRTS
ncbi:hypothetical protein RM11_0863 [Bartonella quintana RM-11]|nr:hypothetical protein RM11_0863 [Bartonella quintana RM-11]